MSRLSHLTSLLSVPSLLSVAMAQAPVSVQWSDDTYGPEGPWHAVSVQIGTPAQRVDLFPAVSYSPNILSKAWCLQASPQPANCQTAPRYFHANDSSTADWTWYTKYGAPNTWLEPLWSDGHWGLITDYMAVPVKGGPALRSNVSLQLVTDGEMKTGPDLSTSQEYSLGTLSLGAPENYLHPLGQGQNHSLPIGNTTATYFSNDQKRLPSASWGLHYGSPSAKVRPSFTYGGYDRSRVLGTPISLQFTNAIVSSLALADIAIGTAEGASPWNFTNNERAGLLRANSSTSASGSSQQLISAAINPGTPYMMLPAATCEAISDAMPGLLVYDANRQISFWNTRHEKYQQVINGPNYLAFTFTQLPTPDVTIKIPFALLNLTQTGLSGTQAPYFPCFRHGNSDFTLGRAFVQGAFFGGNWFAHDIGASNPPPGQWFLAQAPGPGAAAENLQPFGKTQRTISNSSMAWEDTWKGHWTPYNADGTVMATTSSSTGGSTSSAGSDSGLSAGAKAGIAVPVTLVGLALIGLAIWYLLRRRRAAASQNDAEQPTVHEKSGESTQRWELHEREDKPQLLDGAPRAEMEAAVPEGGARKSSRASRRAQYDKPLPAIRHEMPA